MARSLVVGCLLLSSLFPAGPLLVHLLQHPLHHIRFQRIPRQRLRRSQHLLRRIELLLRHQNVRRVQPVVQVSRIERDRLQLHHVRLVQLAALV